MAGRRQVEPERERADEFTRHVWCAALAIQPMAQKAELQKSRKHLTPEQRSAVLRRISAGETQAAVARSVGVSRQAVSVLFNRHETGAQWRQIRVAMNQQMLRRREPWSPEAVGKVARKTLDVQIEPKAFPRLCQRLANAVNLAAQLWEPKLSTAELLNWAKTPEAIELLRREGLAWKAELRRRLEPGYRRYARGCAPPVDKGGPRHSDLKYVDGFTGQLTAWRQCVDEINPRAPRLPEPPWSPGRKSRSSVRVGGPRKHR